VEDFGGNASNAADRERVLNIINDIGSNPDKVVAGKFAGKEQEQEPVVVMYSSE
jgi:filamentous hemagglutinin